jgi:hypothetical protein
MGNEGAMTLWKRVADGVFLCGGVTGAVAVAYLLSFTKMPALEALGGMIGALVYVFGSIVFLIGLGIIVAGAIGHVRSRRQSEGHDA